MKIELKDRKQIEIGDIIAFEDWNTYMVCQHATLSSGVYLVNLETANVIGFNLLEDLIYEISLWKENYRVISSNNIIVKEI